jgi:hypothetical protein
LLHGIVLRAKPRPVGFNSAVQRSPSTLDMTKAPLCPSATTWSPCFGMRFLRLAMPTVSHGLGPITTPWISNFTAANSDGFDNVFGRAPLQYQRPLRLVVISVATVSSIALFGNPLGYLLVKKKLFFDPERSGLIRKGFEMIASGSTQPRTRFCVSSTL